MKNFKAFITTNKEIQINQVGRRQQLVFVNLPFTLEVQIDKNKQIHDIQPREFAGMDLFSKYHGRPMECSVNLIQEMQNLYDEQNNG